MVVDRPEMVPYPEACPEEKYYGLTKTKDVAKCEKRSSFNYFAPGHYGHEVLTLPLNIKIIQRNKIFLVFHYYTIINFCNFS